VRDLLAKKQGNTEAMEVIAAVGCIKVLKESFDEPVVISYRSTRFQGGLTLP
jgi:hypothetical protein